MDSKRRKSLLPVVVVEDHNEVLHHIYRAIGSKKLPFENGCMLHFDSHPDMMIPKHLNAEKINDKEHVLNSLSIENWILPATFAGHFSTLVWIKPFWANQLREGVHHFKIGCEKESKEIRVTCSQAYFVSELAWCPPRALEKSRDVVLEVRTMRVPEASDKAPGDHHQSCALSNETRDTLSSVPFVLDIDLDFYSTRNPFLSLFSKQQFDLLRKLYHYEHPEEESEEALLEAALKRRNQLGELETIFDRLKNSSEPEPSPRVDIVKSLLSTFPQDSPPDLSLLHDAGCTCDDCDLPHHVTPRDSIRHLVAATREFLEGMPKPAYVTIARSSRDDYCPPEDVDFIQEVVIDVLRDVYGDIDLTKDYETEQVDDSQPTTS